MDRIAVMTDNFLPFRGEDEALKPAGLQEPRFSHSSTSCCSSRPVFVRSSSEKFAMMSLISSRETVSF